MRPTILSLSIFVALAACRKEPTAPSDTGVTPRESWELTNFLIESSGSGPIPAQKAEIAFSIKVTARDAYNRTATWFTGTVNITSSTTLIAGGGTTAAFANGVLASHSVMVSDTGSFTLTATRTDSSLPFAAGMSNSFVVNPPPLMIWEQTSLDNIDVSALAVSGTYLFAGTIGRGVFRSLDNGTSWTQAGLTDTTLLCLAINGTRIFAGTESSGVFLSSDNGMNWAQTSLDSLEITSFAVIGTNVFAGTNGNYLAGSDVFLSTDNGTSWTSTGWSGKIPRSLAVLGTNLFGLWSCYAAASFDGGPWMQLGLVQPICGSIGYGGGPSVIAANPQTASLFAGSSGFDGGNLFRSTDYGTNWVTTSLDNKPGLSWSVFSIAVSDSNLFAGTSGGVVLSTDNGTSWSEPADTPFGDFSQMVTSGSNLFAGTRGGVFKGTMRNK